MLADRTLLAATVTATFVAGSVTGYTVREMRGDPPFRPGRAESVYARELTELRREGFDDAELAKAVKIHQDYLDGYQRWWNEFLDSRTAVFDQQDRRFEAEVRKLREEHDARTGNGKR